MIELAFKLGFEYGRRYESLFEKAGLYNGIEIDFESLAIASKAGAMQSTVQGEPKDKVTILQETTIFQDKTPNFPFIFFFYLKHFFYGMPLLHT